MSEYYCTHSLYVMYYWTANWITIHYTVYIAYMNTSSTVFNWLLDCGVCLRFCAAVVRYWILIIVGIPDSTVLYFCLLMRRWSSCMRGSRRSGLACTATGTRSTRGSSNSSSSPFFVRSYCILLVCALLFLQSVQEKEIIKRNIIWSIQWTIEN